MIGYLVTRSSLRRQLNVPIPVKPLLLRALRDLGVYTRPTEVRDGRLWDVISDAPMSSEFAISRFFIPFLCGNGGWALFLDGDMLARGNVGDLLRQIERTDAAVVCVKHKHAAIEGAKKKGDQVQTAYQRKNWSSMMAINCDHPANRKLTIDLLNTAPGRDLHRFCWLADRDIGEVGAEWNWLAGHSDPKIDPKIVHFTAGLPCVAGYEDAPYAEEWRTELMRLMG